MSAWEAAAGASDEWYTPAYIFDALGCQFEMDVAAPFTGPPHVPCNTYIYANSLEEDWRGFVWMNAPFGGRNGLIPWLNKFITHGNGIALTPDRTSAPWFQDAMPHMDAVVFTRKIRFLRPDGTEGKQPGSGTALMAIGDQGMAALTRAVGRGLGCLMLPLLGAANSAMLGEAA